MQLGLFLTAILAQTELTLLFRNKVILETLKHQYKNQCHYFLCFYYSMLLTCQLFSHNLQVHPEKDEVIDKQPVACTESLDSQDHQCFNLPLKLRCVTQFQLFSHAFLFPDRQIPNQNATQSITFLPWLPCFGPAGY